MKKIKLVAFSALLFAAISGVGCKKEKAVNCEQLIRNFTEAKTHFYNEPSKENCTKVSNAAKALLNSDCVSEEVRESASSFKDGCPV